MATRDEPWPQGTPSWVDLMVDDAEAAARFYGDLFGWESEAGSPETGGYRIAMLGGRAVAGIGSVPPGAQMPSVWTTYIAVDDLDATATRVTEHGGTIMMGPMDVMDQGRVAVAADPTGAVFGMWQAQQHIGAGRVNEAGSPIWNECTTRDYEAAKRFYAGVFGYDLQEVGDGQSFHYSLLNLGGNTVGGLGAPRSRHSCRRTTLLVELLRRGRHRRDRGRGRHGRCIDPGPATRQRVRPAGCARWSPRRGVRGDQAERAVRRGRQLSPH